MPPGADTVRVEGPDASMLVGDRETVSPEGKEVAAKATVPEKPPMPVTVIVEMQDDPPTATMREVGSAEMSKSGPFTVTNMSTDWMREEVLPVTVTEYKSGVVPAGAVTVSVDVDIPGITTVVGDSVVLRGTEELVSDTVPVNPPKGSTLMVELLDAPPATTVREYGVDESTKPGPVTVTSTSTE